MHSDINHKLYIFKRNLLRIFTFHWPMTRTKEYGELYFNSFVHVQLMISQGE